MVIQANMSPKAIVEVWENTKEIFEIYNIPLSSITFHELVDGDILRERIVKK